MIGGTGNLSEGISSTDSGAKGWQSAYAQGVLRIFVLWRCPCSKDP